ncbi:Uncharacterised protein [Starkeya nomas]|uniref:Uncharacterized protein n=1 Tax=Starkeya nomas TaxID=2666134 RepID=A0A5S9R7U4_9HYPH|nr:hypothetical protein [Starkeya nomas]CAA0130184.1 Uncharacterised protein [Starkeya nomas]
MSHLPRIEGSAAWALLSPEQQADIGAIAIELVAAWACDDQLNEAAQSGDGLAHEITDLSEAYARAAGFCDAEMISALQDAVVDALPREIFFEGAVARIPSRLGPICRCCGCSASDACWGGCNWTEDDLCSSCAGSRHVFVSADRRGVISIAESVPGEDIVVIDGPENLLTTIVGSAARHGYAGMLLVPGIPEAESDAAALDALVVFQCRLRAALTSRLQTEAAP